jgi:hypothetical protein
MLYCTRSRRHHRDVEPGCAALFHLGGRIFAALAADSARRSPCLGVTDRSAADAARLRPRRGDVKAPAHAVARRRRPIDYEVVLDGSVIMEGRPIAAPGFRYVRGEQPAATRWSPRHGATVAFLSFDRDAGRRHHWQPRSKWL